MKVYRGDSLEERARQFYNSNEVSYSRIGFVNALSKFARAELEEVAQIAAKGGYPKDFEKGAEMKLSEAILLGSTAIGKPMKGTLVGCALGMALTACGKDADDAFGYYDIGDLWPWAWRRKRFTIPCGCHTNGDPDGAMAIMHLFDWHVMTMEDWTLEQLADYVRSIEPPEPEAVDSGIASSGHTESQALLSK